MEEKVLIFGHKNPDTDSICSSLVSESFSKKNGWEVEAVRLGEINKETQYVLDYLRIEAPRLIEKVEEGQSVILVDHNEFNQSIEGIEKAKIEGVTDHHKIANFQTSEPLYFTSRPYGCTATILYEEYKENYSSYMELENKEAILMISSIISDTLLFKSPTCTKYDIKAAEELAKFAQIDIETYGLEMLKAGTDLDEFSEEQLLNMDSKDFETKGVKYSIAQVNTVSIEDVLKRQEKLEDVMNKTIENKGLELFIFAITDILNCNSEVIVIGSRTDIIEKSHALKENRAFLEGVVSRKKQLIPLVENNI